MSQNQNNYSNYPYNENNEFNYSSVAQNYNNSRHRSIQTFVTHGIMRNNSVLFLNDTRFMDLLYNYSDKCKKIYNDYEGISNKNNNRKRENGIRNIVRAESTELNNLMDIMEPVILSKIKNDNRVLTQLVSRGSYGFVYNNSTNRSMKIKIQHINPGNRIFQVYLEFLIMNILYNHSILKYKNAIPKPYYLYKNEDKLRIYIRNIPNSYTLGNYIDEIIYNNKKMKHSTIERMAIKYINLFKILIKICNLLNYFQDTFNFIHNDFHQGNILVVKDKINPNPYIIDFGFASIETNIHDKMYYLTNKINQIPYSRMSDTENEYNICKSIDIMHLIIRLIIECIRYHDVLLLDILKNKFFKYNHTLYSANNLLVDILEKPDFNIPNDIYYFTRDYYKLFNHISSLPKYTKIFKVMPSRKVEFKDEVLLSVLSNFKPNNAAHIFNEIIEELKVHIP